MERFAACLQREQSASRLCRRDRMTRAITIKRYSGALVFSKSVLRHKRAECERSPGISASKQYSLKGEGSGRNVLPHSVWTFFFFFPPSAATDSRAGANPREEWMLISRSLLSRKACFHTETVQIAQRRFRGGGGGCRTRTCHSDSSEKSQRNNLRSRRARAEMENQYGVKNGVELRAFSRAAAAFLPSESARVCKR